MSELTLTQISALIGKIAEALGNKVRHLHTVGCTDEHIFNVIREQMERDMEMVDALCTIDTREGMPYHKVIAQEHYTSSLNIYVPSKFKV